MNKSSKVSIFAGFALALTIGFSPGTSHSTTNEILSHTSARSAVDTTDIDVVGLRPRRAESIEFFVLSADIGHRPRLDRNIVNTILQVKRSTTFGAYDDRSYRRHRHGSDPSLFRPPSKLTT
jgi:hypothetical protein